jgi:small subunit ribosomal protein S4
VSHGHVTVNGRRVDIPSYEVAPGDVVAIAEQARLPGVGEEIDAQAIVAHGELNLRHWANST